MRMYSTEVIDRNSQAGKIILRQQRNGLLHLIFNALRSQIMKRARSGSIEAVYEIYQDSYRTFDQIGFKEGDTFNYYNWLSYIFKSQPSAFRLSMAYILSELISRIAPDEVCEGGCGTGANLFYLSSVHSKPRYMGFDVSENAIKNIHDIQQEGQEFNLNIPPSLLDTLGVNEAVLPSSVEFFCSSMSDINLPDKAVDLFFTKAALEQCNSIMPEALVEIRRVTKKYAVFTEPFSTYNNFLENSYLRSRNYFNKSEKYMIDNGFKIIHHFDIIPKKPTFNFSIMVCQVL